MNASAPASGCSFGQSMVSQTPVFDNGVRKRRGSGFSSNQVMGKSGIIRPSKKKKPKYL